MQRLTTRASGETMRNLAPVLLCLIFALLAGCSTPGLNHAYVSVSERSRTIQDLGSERDPATTIPTFVRFPDQVLGFAYDPYTDHIFLRLGPGNRFRVIDRPASQIKRGFTASSVPAGGKDVAIRSRDRHLFLAMGDQTLREITLYGDEVRTITLDGLTQPAEGVAYDQKRNQFLILSDREHPTLSIHSLDGKLLSRAELSVPALITSAGFDSDAGELYAPLRDGEGLGVYDREGQWIRTLSNDSIKSAVQVDAGPRSLLRMF